jgi:hypothetical protein
MESFGLLLISIVLAALIHVYAPVRSAKPPVPVPAEEKSAESSPGERAASVAR